MPHILADESSAYYHGYVLAEMSVHQTRDYFQSKYDSIADNPEVGKELTEVRPAASKPPQLKILCCPVTYLQQMCGIQI